MKVENISSEAPNDVVLKDVIAKTDVEQLKHLYPENFFHAEEGPHDPLLSIQATHFPCGGLAVAISVSHRVFDASSLGTLVVAWSCNAGDKTLINPTFHLPSLLPCNESDSESGEDSKKVKYNKGPSNNNNGNKTVVKRLLFTKEIIASLKTKTDTKPVSNSRIASAVIAKG